MIEQSERDLHAYALGELDALAAAADELRRLYLAGYFAGMEPAELDARRHLARIRQALPRLERAASMGRHPTRYAHTGGPRVPDWRERAAGDFD